MITEITQDTSKDKWWTQGLENDSMLFYHLTWSSKNFMKFGYKLAPQNMKSDYGKIYHIPPSTSHIWKITANFTENHTTTEIRKIIIKMYFRHYVPWFEAKIHKKLKLNTDFKTLPKLKEFYGPVNKDSSLKTIRNCLLSFEHDFIKWITERDKENQKRIEFLYKPERQSKKI